jgi:hypothetical protein
VPTGPDDGIVVIAFGLDDEHGCGEKRGRKGKVDNAAATGRPRSPATAGDEGTEALTDMVFTAGQEWRDDVLGVLENRFEIRLKSEIGALRVDVTRELAAMRVENLRWSFVFWISQLGAMAALLNYFK